MLFAIPVALFAIPVAAEIVELLFLSGVEAFVEREQLRIFFFQRSEPCLQHGLVERDPGFESREIRLAGANGGLLVVDGLGARIDEVLVSGLLRVGETKVLGQPVRQLVVMAVLGRRCANAIIDRPAVFPGGPRWTET